MTNTASNLYVNNRVVKKILFNDAEMYTSKGWAYKPEDYSYSKIFTEVGSTPDSTKLYSDSQQNIYITRELYFSNPSNNSGTRTRLTKYNPLGVKCWSIDSSDNIPAEVKNRVISINYTYVSVDDSNNDTLWAIMHTYCNTNLSYSQCWDYLVKIDNKTGTIIKTIDIHKAAKFTDNPQDSYIVYGLVAHKGNTFLMLSWEHQYYQDNSLWTNYSRYFFMFDSEGTLQRNLEKSVTYRSVKGIAMTSNEDIVFIIFNTAYLVRKADNYSSISIIGALNSEVDDSWNTSILQNSLVTDTVGSVYCATRYQIQKYNTSSFYSTMQSVYVYDEKNTKYTLEISRIVVDDDDCLYVFASGHDTVSTSSDSKDYLIKYSPDLTMLWQYKANKGDIPSNSLASFGNGVGFAKYASGNKNTDIGMLSGIPKKY